MSMNNYIRIKETKDGFEVTERDADTDSQYGEGVVCKDLRKAIDKGSEIDSEYGIRFHPYF